MDAFFSQRREGPFTVIDFQTESLMNHADLERIGQALYRVIDEEQQKQVLLDFTRVRFLSSQAIGILLTLNKKLSQVEGGKLVLCGVGPSLMELLKITRLNRVFTIRPTRKDALAHGMTLAELTVVIGMIVVLVALLLPFLSKARDTATRIRCASNLRQIGSAFLLYAEANEGCFPLAASRRHIGQQPPPTPDREDRPEDWIHWRTPPNKGGISTSAIAKYVSSSAQMLDQVFRCPVDDVQRHDALLKGYDPVAWATYGPYFYSYSMNGYMDPQGLWMDANRNTCHTRLRLITNPANKTLLVEESEQTINDGHWKPGNYDTGKWNVEFDRLSIRHDNVRDDDEAIETSVVAWPDKRGNCCFCDGHVEFVTRTFAHDPTHVIANQF